jgi:hypothetical protein
MGMDLSSKRNASKGMIGYSSRVEETVKQDLIDPPVDP